MSTLIFITSRFPFEPGEPFIEAEFPFIYSNFSRVIIITRDVATRKARPIPDDVKIYRYNPASTFTGYLAVPILLFRNRKKIAAIYKDEIKFRNDRSLSLSLRKKLLLLKKIIKGLQLKFFIENVIGTEKIEGLITLYSYWMNNGAHAICMLDQQNKFKIARAHRIDLYEEVNTLNYIPLQKYTFDNLDGLFFISEHGKEYFENKLGITHPKNQVARLGVIKPSLNDVRKSGSDFFRIVTCSSLTKVKRIDLLISALENLNTDRNIIWNHFGEGPLKNELSGLAQSRLGPLKNIEYKFMGQVQNSELLEFYSNNEIDLFINSSSSEGIPVSIMEAQSFGIPVIATDVGGVKEILVEGTGSVLPVDIKPEQLAGIIKLYIDMPVEEVNKIRTNAYNNWNRRFNASVNYKDFVLKVNSILATAKKTDITI